MIRLGSLVILMCLAPFLLAQKEKEKKEEARPNTLTAKEIADGWILLFDGETTFGWKIEGDAKVEKGELILGGTKETRAYSSTWFSVYAVEFEGSWEGKTEPTCEIGPSSLAKLLLDESNKGKFVLQKAGVKTEAAIHPLSVIVPAGSTLRLRTVKLLPNPDANKMFAFRARMYTQKMTPLFNGKDLTGWKVFRGNPKQERSKFTVTKEGWLNVKDGPGDLQTEKTFDNFVLQLDCISNGDRLNSGVFFRCLPDKYQQGYEAQVHNGWLDRPKEIAVDDYDPVGKRSFKRKVTTTAMDFGTGAIYRRQPARRAVAKDKEWFTMTVVANSRHFATWVNGIQQVDWTDNRPANDNARQGYRAKAGAISLQGHDPTTDLSFRNIRIAPLP